LAKWGEEITIEDITPTMVTKHLLERAKEVSNNTWNRDRKNLLAMFNWIKKIKKVAHNPVLDIECLPVERKVDYIPPKEDIHKVLKACTEQDRVMLLCYYYTFARRGEIFDWTWEDINFKEYSFRLWTKKRRNGNREHDDFELPEDTALYKALKWQYDHRDEKSPYVFTNPETGDKYTHRNRFMKGLCKRAGVKPFGIKAFRKYGPSVLNEMGISMKKLQGMLRHKSQKTTETYLTKIDPDLSVGLRLLETEDTQWDTQIKKEAINE